MKELFGKMIKKIRSNKGETLMECIASVLILMFVMAIIGTMIQSSLLMTETLTKRAFEEQTIVNDIILGASTGSGTITFNTTAAGITATFHPVAIYDQDGIIAFRPL